MESRRGCYCFILAATVVVASAGILQKNDKYSLSFRSETPASISILAQRPHTPDSSILINISSDVGVAVVRIVLQREKFNDNCILNFDTVYHHVAIRGMPLYV